MFEHVLSYHVVKLRGYLGNGAGTVADLTAPIGLTRSRHFHLAVFRVVRGFTALDAFHPRT